MKKILFAAAALAISAMPAAAQSAAYNWSGLYIGANVGFANANSDFSGTVPCSTACAYFAAANAALINGAPNGSGDSTGFTGGVQAGYNWQTGAIVFGIEADFNFTDLQTR